jgi:16S rRNA (guanine966-N2)-methyltransferase
MTMRIIAGQYRSRVLAAPAGMATRPTSDRLRETLFNVLAPKIAGMRFLDLYAGSGAVGIEALSRGAAQVTFVERAPAALKAVRLNLEQLGITAGFQIHGDTVAGFLRSVSAASPKREPYEVLFMDPPYEAAKEYETTLGMLGGAAITELAPGAIVIAEHRRKDGPEGRYGALERTRLLEQGDAALSFYERAD